MPFQGQPYTLTVQWLAYEGGPAEDVTAQTITIKLVADGTTILAATSTGITHLASGLYAYRWSVASDAVLGEYVAVWDATDEASEAVQVSEIVTVAHSGTDVTVDDVVAYIGAATCVTWADESGEAFPQIEDALAAEARAQLRRVCYPQPTDDDPTPDVSDLHEALKRRVQRNLALRPLPLAMQPQGDSGLVARPSSNDPEIRRLEGPYRRHPVG